MVSFSLVCRLIAFVSLICLTNTFIVIGVRDMFFSLSIQFFSSVLFVSFIKFFSCFSAQNSKNSFNDMINVFWIAFESIYKIKEKRTKFIWKFVWNSKLKTKYTYCVYMCNIQSNAKQKSYVFSQFVSFFFWFTHICTVWCSYSPPICVHNIIVNR